MCSLINSKNVVLNADLCDGLLFKLIVGSREFNFVEAVSFDLSQLLVSLLPREVILGHEIKSRQVMHPFTLCHSLTSRAR